MAEDTNDMLGIDAEMLKLDDYKSARPTYVGTKLIQAEAMTKGDFHKYKNWGQALANEADINGYLVVYQDGYESWSPKAQFEEAYLSLGDCSNLAPHQIRVLAEQAELNKKLVKLESFIAENTKLRELDIFEQVRLVMQHTVMKQYHDILVQRIKAWGQP